MLCQIREKFFNSEADEWAVSLEACGELHDLFLHDPFSAIDEEEVDWFFQRYSRFPLADTVRAENVVKAIEDYGKSLFRQTIGAVSSSSTSKRYCDLRKEGCLDELCIEVTGSAAFQRLHWEALRDDQPGFDGRPLALQVEVIRRPLATTEPNLRTRHTYWKPSKTRDTAPAWSLPSRPFNILLVVARPAGAQDAGLRVISRPLLDALYTSTPDHTLQARLDVVRPGSFEEFKAQLEKASSSGVQYDVVHFDLHGKVTDDRKEYVNPSDTIRHN